MSSGLGFSQSSNGTVRISERSEDRLLSSDKSTDNAFVESFTGNLLPGRVSEFTLVRSVRSVARYANNPSGAKDRAAHAD